MATYTGTGKVTTADFKEVVFTGKTKSGADISITLHNAINRGNLDWTFAEKNDTVASIEFEACYDNTDEMASSTTEPFSIVCSDSLTGASCIMLGAGEVSIGGTTIALTRGGSQFTVEREYREINADGDRGAVKDRLVMDGSRPKLKVNALTILANISELYPALATTK